MRRVSCIILRLLQKYTRNKMHTFHNCRRHSIYTYICVRIIYIRCVYVSFTILKRYVSIPTYVILTSTWTISEDIAFENKPKK